MLAVPGGLGSRSLAPPATGDVLFDKLHQPAALGAFERENILEAPAIG